MKRASNQRGVVSRMSGAKHFHPVAVIVGRIVGTVPYGFSKEKVEVLGKVDVVPVDVRLRVLADGARGVSFEAGLARRNVVGTEGTLLLAPFGAITLRRDS